MPVVLATDALVWLLVAAVAAFAWASARRPHLAAPWARVFRSRAAMASCVILAAYVLVGLLDSLHYRPALPSKDPQAPVAYAVEVRSVLDAALICAAQKVEHYEIAGYGCARTFAQQLGHDDIAELLQETLDEEGSADKKLTEIAESVVNQEAESAGVGGED